MFSPCPGQKNAFTVILRVIVQIDINQHFKYGTISSAYRYILVRFMQTDKTYDHRNMLGNDHWLNCTNKNRLFLFHSLHGWLHPLCLRSVLIILSKHWHNMKNGCRYLLLTVRSTQCYYWRLQLVVAYLSSCYPSP